MHEPFMLEAIRLAREKMRENGGGPFGAVIVKDGVIIGRGWNQVTTTHDPTAHAEMMAIRAAGRHLGDFRLLGCVLYSSCEPCPMCLSAVYWARLDRIYFAATRHDAAEAGFDDEFLYHEIPRPASERQLPCEPFLREAALPLLAEWKARTDKVAY